MEMNEFVNMLVNNSVSIVVIAYFMFRDYKFMGALQDTLNKLVIIVDTLKDVITHGEGHADG